MTKTEEKLLAHVRAINTRGALAGLFTNPEEESFKNKEHRFVRRLKEAGQIIWVPYTNELGAGWVLPEFVKKLGVFLPTHVFVLEDGTEVPVIVEERSDFIAWEKDETPWYTVMGPTHTAWSCRKRNVVRVREVRVLPS